MFVWVEGVDLERKEWMIRAGNCVTFLLFFWYFSYFLLFSAYGCFSIKSDCTNNKAWIITGEAERTWNITVLEHIWTRREPTKRAETQTEKSVSVLCTCTSFQISLHLPTDQILPLTDSLGEKNGVKRAEDAERLMLVPSHARNGSCGWFLVKS